MAAIIKTAVLAIFLVLPTWGAWANPATYQLRINGLACPFCAYGVEKKLIGTQGVKSIKIDIDAGTVTVFMANDATLSEAMAKQIVKDAGFTLAGFEKLKDPGKGKRD